MEKIADVFKDVLLSPNAWLFLVFLIIVTVFFIKMSKAGLFSLKTKNLQIGNSEIERTIIRNQTDLAYLYIMALESKIDADHQFNFYITRYILEKVYDEVIEWITFNHITNSKEYVEIKQEKIIYLVDGIGVNPSIQTKEFKDRMKGWTKELIERLVQVRELYEKK